MNRLWQKLRGAIGVGLTWGISWALIMFLIGLVVLVVDPDSIDPGEGPPYLAAVVGFVGFLCGLSFSAILSLAENKKPVSELSPLRATLWGILGSAALPLLIGLQPSVLFNTVPLGAIFASATVAIARRAALREREDVKQLVGELPGALGDGGAKGA